MDGYKKAKEVADKLKEEKSAAEEKALETKEQVQNQLEAIKGNDALLAMYQENAQVGAKNLSGETPQLKIHQAGKSTTNELANGDRPTDGWFFYKPTQEQFQTVTCHILTISQGFRAPGMKQPDGTTPMVFNQIVAGVFGSDYKPFVFYLSGKKLSRMWEFGKLAAKYTRAKPVPIPMFALTVQLSTEIEKNNYGESWVANFDILKNESGFPLVVTDPGEFQFLKDQVDEMEELISQLIAAKASEEGEVIPGETVENVDPNGIPFS